MFTVELFTIFKTTLFVPEILEGDEKELGSGYLTHYEDLEKCVIEETKLFYASRSQEMVDSLNVAEYVEKAEELLETEKSRVDNYLHRSTPAKLMPVCVQALVGHHVKWLKKGFKDVLSAERTEELAAIYKLIKRTPENISGFVDIFEEHYMQQGLGAVKAIGEAALNDPTTYTNALLEVMNKYENLIKTAFENHESFKAAFGQVSKKFINKNAVTEHHSCNSNKSPELIAKHCDSLLKNSTHKSDDEIEKALEMTIQVFKYLENKDFFQLLYWKQLSKRLVGNLSYSDDAEASMISKLKDSCGWEYTEKLQSMINDVATSKDTSTRFKESFDEDTSLDFDFTVKILCNRKWPLQSNITCNLSSKLERTLSSMSAFYTNGSSRKLTWLYEHSKGEIVTKNFKNRYTFSVSILQTAVLEQFNSATSYTVHQLHAQTGLQFHILTQILSFFLKSHLLLSEEKGLEKDHEKISPQTVISLNLGYRNKKLRMNFNIPIKSEVKKDEELVKAQIDRDRKYEIDCAIVRIMKMRKTLDLQNLIMQICEQLKNRFHPEVKMIKVSDVRII